MKFVTEDVLLQLLSDTKENRISILYRKPVKMNKKENPFYRKEGRSFIETAKVEKEIEAANVRLAQAELAGILATKRVSDSGMAVYAARIDVRERKDLLTYADLLRDKMDTGVALLGTILDAKPALICVVTQDAVARGLHAGKLVGACAAIVGGKGGGRPNTAQAGGTDTAKLDDAIAHIHTLV